MDEKRYYTTVSGDMWDSIAYAFYGDVKYIGLLMDSNPHLLDISVFSMALRFISRSCQKKATKTFQNGECKPCKRDSLMFP